MSEEHREDAAVPVEGWPAESAQRCEKAAALRALGANPYPNRFVRTHTLGGIVAAHGEKSLEELESLGLEVRIAGRVVLKRPMGKASFEKASGTDAPGKPVKFSHWE